MALTNFTTRLLTSAAIVVVYTVLFVLRALVPVFGIYAFDAAFLIFAFLCVIEVCNAKKLANRGANIYVVYVILALLYLFYIIGQSVLDPVLPWWLQLILSVLIIGIFALFIGFSNMLDKNLAKECNLQKKNLNKEAWGGVLDLLQMLAYPGFSFACLILMNHMVDNQLGLLGLLLVFFTSCFSDVFAYCVGMLLGRGARKMAPKISPKKTWVGFIGGLFGGILAALIVVWISSADEVMGAYIVNKFGGAALTQLFFAIIGVASAIFTTCGDLFASYIKRKADIKDFGHFLPGHGGFMDRLDGIIFNAPFIFLIMGII